MRLVWVLKTGTVANGNQHHELIFEKQLKKIQISGMCLSYKKTKNKNPKALLPKALIKKITVVVGPHRLGTSRQSPNYG